MVIPVAPAAGVAVDLERAEVARARVTADHHLLLTTDRGDTCLTSVMILCTGHNPPQDHYGLSAARNYVRDRAPVRRPPG